MPADRQDLKQLSDEEWGVYWNSFFCFFRMSGFSVEDAEDLAQEATLKAWRVCHKWEGRANASLKTFLITVGRNAGRDYLKKQKRHVRISELISRLIREYGLNEG